MNVNDNVLNSVDSNVSYDVNTSALNGNIDSKIETFKNKFGLSQYTSILLANSVRVFHIILILFVLFAPFLNSPALWVLHITFSISLLVHWVSNNNTCSLSIFEAKLRGLEYTDSFSHQFIAPIYDISKTQWSRTCYIVTIGLMSISIYYLYNSKAFTKALECFREQRKKYKENPAPFGERLMGYINCFLPLLILN
jgi:hypothetical protein